MLAEPVRTLEFPAATQSFACAVCDRGLPRRVRFCPYCAAEHAGRRQPAAEPGEEHASNVIVAEFGFRDVEAPPPEAPLPRPAQRPELPLKETANTPSPASAQAAQDPAPANAPEIQKQSAENGQAAVRRRNAFIAFYAALFVFAAIVLFSLGRSPHPADIQSPPVESAPPVTVYALRDDTAVRDRPTAVRSQIVGNLHRGDAVAGEWRQANGAGSRWLKIASGRWAGDYVWDRNLSQSPPPGLLSAFDTYRTTNTLTDVRSSPDPMAVKIETVRPGRRVLVAGEIEGGWYEIRLRRGGVGYALAANFR